MSLLHFVLFTGLGALVWCTILTWIGWFIGTRENVILQVLDQEAQRYTGRALLIVLPILTVIAAAYVWWYRRRASQIERGAREAGRREGGST
jgi:membrane protein DedA with SNARE-associated domain